MKSLIKKIPFIVPVYEALHHQYDIQRKKPWRGMWKQFWVHRVTRKPFLFSDWLNNSYWIYPSDNIVYIVDQGTITDSKNVITLIENIVQPGWTCFDVGSHIGSTTIPMWNHTTETGKVVSFEADPSNVERLKRNLRQNNKTDEHVIFNAVCDQEKTVTLSIIEERNGWQTLGDPSRDNEMNPNETIKKVDVAGITLDSFCKLQHIEKVDFIKIDVEGAEVDVLLGAQELFSQHAVQFAVFEIAPKMLTWFKNRTAQDAIDLVSKHNYSIYEIMSDGTLIKLESLIWSKDKHADCLAVAPNATVPPELLQPNKVV